MKSAIFYNKSINHYGEEVCGDHYKYASTEGFKIAVLSDGLGSGIKASILSILSTEIILTLLKNGIELEEVVDTVIKTLPICKVREISYATFTIIQIFDNGFVKLVNFDNPKASIYKKGQWVDPNYEKIMINGKEIQKSEFYLNNDDYIFLLTDGIVHAGINKRFNLGWGLENIREHLEFSLSKKIKLEEIVDGLVDKTAEHYGFEPGDDATVVGIKIVDKVRLKIFTGPPLNPRNDEIIAEEFMNFKGTKVICGGTTGNIIAEYLGKEIKIDVTHPKSNDLPPVGQLEGVDLITEGTLTLQFLNKILSNCKLDFLELDSIMIEKENGAWKLIQLIREAEEVYLLVGQTINAYYHNPQLPFEMTLRGNLIRELCSHLERLNKKLIIEYC